MTITVSRNTHDRALWTAALTLPDQPDLPTSLIAELAEYLGLPVALVAERCRKATADLAQTWQAQPPTTPTAITAFYRQADAYLYDLTWWHTLSADDSALIQAEVLRLAAERQAATVLDFGSGIGSLGLLLAQAGRVVTLADVNPRLLDYARRRFARRGLAAQLLDLAPDVNGVTPQLPTAAFDFISAVDVFEHLPDPPATLIALGAALRPGGTLFVHLPTEADQAHPMHLWHDPDMLLRHLHAAGLWLEQAAGPRLILRRGAGPRYCLASGMELLPDDAGGMLLSTQPLVAMRLNRQAFGLLAGVDGGATATELSRVVPDLRLTDMIAFLDNLTQRRLLTKQLPAPAAWPSVSVIIPAHGRPEATRACVTSLLTLDYPPDRLEVIVVDDASDPPLAPALAGLPVRLLRQERNIGQSAARNLAATQAQGTLLAFIDNDCRADPDWLRALVAAMSEPDVAIVGGRVIAPEPTGPVAAFEAVRSPLDMGPHSGEVGPGQRVAYMPTCNLVVRRDALLEVQGFTAVMLLGEDVDFIWRVIQAGGRARYEPEGQVVHHHRVQLGALLRRRADYGSSEADLQRRHPVGRRVMPMPIVGLLLLAALVIGSIAWPISLLLPAVAVARLLQEMRQKARQLRQAGVALPTRRIAGAILAEHGASLYHLGANVIRYYSLPLLLVGLFWPPLLLPLLILGLIPPVTDYWRLRPRLALPLFVGLSWLELAAYQLGVWRGCLQGRTLRPFLPQLRWGR